MTKGICQYCALYGHTCIGRDGKLECMEFQEKEAK